MTIDVVADPNNMERHTLVGSALNSVIIPLLKRLVLPTGTNNQAAGIFPFDKNRATGKRAFAHFKIIGHGHRIMVLHGAPECSRVLLSSAECC